MLNVSSTDTLPSIIVSDADENRLTALANSAMLFGRSHEAARVLLAEMERAQVVSSRSVPANVVRMQSLVRFEVDGASPRRVQLVYPGEANIDQDKISVLTPIGAALIGLSSGQSMVLTGYDGRPHRITVLSVAPAPVSAAA